MKGIKPSSVALTVGILFLAIALVVGLIAIWTVGPEAQRMGGTAAIFGVPGFLLSLGSLMAKYA